MSLTSKLFNKNLRKQRVRSKVYGTAERPRMSVSISNKHISVQLIDDDKAVTIVSATTVGQKLSGSMSERASSLGTEIAKKAKKAKISKVIFDRNGRLYAKRLNSLAEAAREEGLEF